MGMHGAGWWSYVSNSGEKPKITRALIRRVMNYAAPYKWQISGMLVIILFTTGLSLITPLILRDLIDRTIPSKNMNRLVMLALALLMIPLTNGLLNVVNRRLNSYVGEGVIYDLRRALYNRLQRMSLRFFTNTKVGEMMSRLNNDVVGAQSAVSNTIVSIVTSLIQAVAVGIVMLSLEWHLTLVSIMILPLFIVVARRLGSRLREISHQQLEANARMNAMMSETLNIGGALLVKLFGRTDIEIDRFAQRASRVRDLGITRSVTGAVFFAIIGLISAVGSALVYGIGGWLVIQNIFTVGTIVAFGAYMSILYSALQGLSNAPVDFATSLVSFERVFEVIDLPVDIPEKPNGVVLDEVDGRLVFDDVTFLYGQRGVSVLSEVERAGKIENIRAVLSDDQPRQRLVSKEPLQPRQAGKPAVGGNGHAVTETLPGGDGGAGDNYGGAEMEGGEAPGEGEREIQKIVKSQAREEALQNISFEVEPGQLVALVGPSGAGKTTLTYLIPRLYDPTSGRILIDGFDLRDVTLESLARQIGMVTQETYLFHDTIRTNLLYARLDASDAELEAAARAANIHDFIQGLPEGYDTLVGERGYRLSGGEKQRLALARVILKNPRILVLDEATSSLDSESEALIQDALKRVMAGRTSIVIAHRLSTILAADLILVIDRGQIVERGTHQELLAQEGLYAHLYHTQFSREQS